MKSLEKSALPQQKPNGEHQDILYKRTRQSSECDPKDNPDRHVDHVTLNGELTELFKHGPFPTAARVSGS